ncbi:MAG: 30S ribosome-binding factor RbfA [Hungatella sp.]|nr:30S ribosome-binding factor RbfA [Hungatella sp.]
MRKNSVKNTRINMEVQRELSEIIRTEVKDPALNNIMVSVVSVEVSPDLKYCKAYVSVLGSQEAAGAALDGLKRAVGFIRRELARRVNLRNTPELKFILDQSIEYGVHMTRLIDDVTQDMKSREPEEDQDSEDWWDEPEE